MKAGQIRGMQAVQQSAMVPRMSYVEQRINR